MEINIFCRAFMINNTNDNEISNYNSSNNVTDNGDNCGWKAKLF